MHAKEKGKLTNRKHTHTQNTGKDRTIVTEKEAASRIRSKKKSFQLQNSKTTERNQNHFSHVYKDTHTHIQTCRTHTIQRFTFKVCTRFPFILDAFSFCIFPLILRWKKMPTTTTHCNHVFRLFFYPPNISRCSPCLTVFFLMLKLKRKIEELSVYSI